MRENLAKLFEAIEKSDISNEEKLQIKKEVLVLIYEMIDEIPNLVKYDLLTMCFSNYPKQIFEMIDNEYRTGSKQTLARLHIETNATLLLRISQRFNVPPVIPGYKDRIMAEDQTADLLHELVQNRKL